MFSMEKIGEYLLGFIVAICTLLIPIKGLVFIVLLFVLLDTILSIYTTIKLNGLNSLRSHKLFNIVPKTLFYTTTIIALFLTDNFIFGGSIWGISYLFSKSVSLIWIYIEIKSLDETSIRLGNKSIWVHLKNLMNKIKAFKKDINEIGDVGKGDYIDKDK